MTMTGETGGFAVAGVCVITQVGMPKGGGGAWWSCRAARFLLDSGLPDIDGCGVAGQLRLMAQLAEVQLNGATG